MLEPTSNKHYETKFEFPLWKLIKHRAEEKDMPIILTKDDSATVVENIEGILGGSKLSQVSKAERLAEVIEKNLDIQAVYKGLGLTG